MTGFTEQLGKSAATVLIIWAMAIHVFRWQIYVVQQANFLHPPAIIIARFFRNTGYATGHFGNGIWAVAGIELGGEQKGSKEKMLQAPGLHQLPRSYQARHNR